MASTVFAQRYQELIGCWNKRHSVEREKEDVKEKVLLNESLQILID